METKKPNTGFWNEALKHSAPLAILSVLLSVIITLRNGTVVFALNDLVSWLVLVCILGIAFSLYYYFREKSHRARNAEIEQAVKTRTEELKTRNTSQQAEITRLQKQLVQSPTVIQPIKTAASTSDSGSANDDDFTKPE